MTNLQEIKKLYKNAWNEITNDPIQGGENHFRLTKRIYEIVGFLLMEVDKLTIKENREKAPNWRGFDDE